jgi:hypothetical protein
MSDDEHHFPVIDLLSQAEAISHELHGKPVEERLRWIEARGSVQCVADAEHPRYLFRSSAGVEHVFFFTHDGLAIVLDNTIASFPRLRSVAALDGQFFRTPFCPRCTYPRTGLTPDTRCPECGWKPQCGEIILWGVRVIRNRSGQLVPWTQDSASWSLPTVLLWIIAAFLIFKAQPSPWVLSGAGMIAALAFASVGVFWFVMYEWTRRRCLGTLGVSDQLVICRAGVGHRVGAGRVKLTPWRDIEQVSYTVGTDTCRFIAQHHPLASAPMTAPHMIDVSKAENAVSDAWALAEGYRV